MRKDTAIPFFENTPDDTHCFQASLKMVMGHFLPERDFTWEELEAITAKVERLWTWPLAGLVWLAQNGFDVKNIEVFDYDRFIEVGAQYMFERHGEEVARAQIENSDIDQEVELAKTFIDVVDTTFEIPAVETITDFLRGDWLVIVNVNSRALSGKSGYSGHYVVVKGFDDDTLILNNPGLPGIENQEVPFDVFENAWAYSGDKSKNVMAIRLQETRS